MADKNQLPDWRDEKALAKWLELFPKEFAASVSVRAALLSIPMIGVLSKEELSHWLNQRAMLATFRALVLSLHLLRETTPFALKATKRAFFHPADLFRRGTVRKEMWDGLEAVSHCVRASTITDDELFVVADEAVAALRSASKAIGRNRSIGQKIVSSFIQQAIADVGATHLDRKFVEDQLRLPIWFNSVATEFFKPFWSDLKNALTETDTNWRVWTDWAEFKFGADGNWAHSPFSGRSDWPKPIYDELTKWREEWDRPPAEVNADIKRLLELHTRTTQRDDIVDAASPAAALTKDNKLDLVPNATFDKPQAGPDLASLPFMQLAICRSLHNALPANTDKVISQALEEYAGELSARGVNPIVGLLKQLYDIIESGLGRAPEAREWMSDAVKTAWGHFERNHADLLEHFPLDLRRDEIYADTRIDETKVADRLKEYGDALKSAVDVLHAEGRATDQARDIANRLQEGARIVAQTPDPPPLAVPPEDVPRPVSPKKRSFLNIAGTIGSIIKVLSDATKIVDSPAVQAGLKTLRELWDKMNPF